MHQSTNMIQMRFVSHIAQRFNYNQIFLRAPSYSRIPRSNCGGGDQDAVCSTTRECPPRSIGGEAKPQGGCIRTCSFIIKLLHLCSRRLIESSQSLALQLPWKAGLLMVSWTSTSRMATNGLWSFSVTEIVLVNIVVASLACTAV